MPAERTPYPSRMLAGVAASFRGVVDSFTRFGYWLHRLVRPHPGKQFSVSSRAGREELLQYIKVLEPGNTWLQSRKETKLSDLLSRRQCSLLARALNLQNSTRGEAAARLYFQIQDKIPGLASHLVEVMLDAGRRPFDWARAIEVPGTTNAYQLDNCLYRGAQPNGEGLRHLVTQNFHIINLRQFHSDNIDPGQGTRFRVYTRRPKEHVVPVLKAILSQQKLGRKVYIHCWHGSDRTGFMCAVYRMVVQGWPVDKALQEYIKGGYGYHGRVFPELPGLLYSLDVEKIRAELDLGKPL